MLARQIHGADTERLGLAVGQEADEGTAGEIRADEIGRQHRDPGAGKGCPARDGRLVALQLPSHGYPERLTVLPEAEIGAADGGMGDAPGVAKVVRSGTGAGAHAGSRNSIRPRTVGRMR